MYGPDDLEAMHRVRRVVRSEGDLQPRQDARLRRRLGRRTAGAPRPAPARARRRHPSRMSTAHGGFADAGARRPRSRSCGMRWARPPREVSASCRAARGTKDALSSPGDDMVALDLAAITGIVEYAPSEFTITALAGTPIAELAATLAEHGQYLPFDPILIDAGATLGGTIAAGVSRIGPRPLRRHPRLHPGRAVPRRRGTLVRGGGKVVKNAAGFDLPKLMVGSLGSMGIVVEATLKVFPRAEVTATGLVDHASLDLAVACDAPAAARAVRGRRARSRAAGPAVDPPRRARAGDRGAARSRASDRGGRPVRLGSSTPARRRRIGARCASWPGSRHGWSADQGAAPAGKDRRGRVGDPDRGGGAGGAGGEAGRSRVTPRRPAGDDRAGRRVGRWSISIARSKGSASPGSWCAGAAIAAGSDGAPRKPRSSARGGRSIRRAGFATLDSRAARAHATHHRRRALAAGGRPRRGGDGGRGRELRALRLLPPGLSHLSGARRGDGLAARAHRADEGGARGSASDRGRGAVRRSLPGLSRLRAGLPVGCAVPPSCSIRSATWRDERDGRRRRSRSARSAAPASDALGAAAPGVVPARVAAARLGRFTAPVLPPSWRSLLDWAGEAPRPLPRVAPLPRWSQPRDATRPRGAPRRLRAAGAAARDHRGGVAGPGEKRRRGRDPAGAGLLRIARDARRPARRRARASRARTSPPSRATSTPSSPPRPVRLGDRRVSRSLRRHARRAGGARARRSRRRHPRVPRSARSRARAAARSRSGDRVPGRLSSAPGARHHGRAAARAARDRRRAPARDRGRRPLLRLGGDVQPRAARDRAPASASARRAR